MVEIQVDTKKVNECGNTLMNLSVEFNEELDSLFKRIENMPASTLEWVGESANKFVELVKIEKNAYYQLKDALYNHGKYLVEFADKMGTTVEKGEKMPL